MSTYTQQTTGPDNQGGESSEDNARSKLANSSSNNQTVKTDNESGEKVHVSINRRIEMPPDFMFPEDETPPSDLLGQRVEEIENGDSESQGGVGKESGSDSVDNMAPILPLSELEKLRIDNSVNDKVTDDDDINSNKTNNNILIPNDDSRHPDGADTTHILNEEGKSGKIYYQ